MSSFHADRNSAPLRIRADRPRLNRVCYDFVIVAQRHHITQPGAAEFPGFDEKNLSSHCLHEKTLATRAFGSRSAEFQLRVPAHARPPLGYHSATKSEGAQESFRRVLRRRYGGLLRRQGPVHGVQGNPERTQQGPWRVATGTAEQHGREENCAKQHCPSSRTRLVDLFRTDSHQRLCVSTTWNAK